LQADIVYYRGCNDYVECYRTVLKEGAGNGTPLGPGILILLWVFWHFKIVYYSFRFQFFMLILFITGGVMTMLNVIEQCEIRVLATAPLLGLEC
jgi:hypothetical protein